MASYLIANYKVTNQEGYGAYLAAVGPTLAAYGGKILVAGAGSDTVEGSPDPITIVLEFPTPVMTQMSVLMTLVMETPPVTM